MAGHGSFTMQTLVCEMNGNVSGAPNDKSVRWRVRISP